MRYFYTFLYKIFQLLYNISFNVYIQEYFTNKLKLVCNIINII